MFEHFGYIMAEGLPKEKKREVFESLRHSDPEGYELYAPDLDDMILVNKYEGRMGTVREIHVKKIK